MYNPRQSDADAPTSSFTSQQRPKHPPWLGFVIFPRRRRLKARKARHATRHLRRLFVAWRAGEIAFAELDAAVKGWVHHAAHGDTEGLRWEVMRRMARR